MYLEDRAPTEDEGEDSGEESAEGTGDEAGDYLSNYSSESEEDEDGATDVYDSDSEEENKRLVNGHGGSWGLKKVVSLYKIASPSSSVAAGPLDARMSGCPNPSKHS